jgi:hypothetical protein
MYDFIGIVKLLELTQYKILLLLLLLLLLILQGEFWGDFANACF